MNFNDEELEDQFPKKPTTTTQTSKPSVVFEEFKVVDPTRNINGEPIIPKDEPVDWDSLPIPELNLPIFKTKKTNTRASKKVKPVSLKSKALTKSQPTVNKRDLMYMCDIKEFSDLNLYLDELEEVRRIDAYRHLPERLVFKYKGGKEMTWPLHMILQESQSVLIKSLLILQKELWIQCDCKKNSSKED